MYAGPTRRSVFPHPMAVTPLITKIMAIASVRPSCRFRILPPLLTAFLNVPEWKAPPAVGPRERQRMAAIQQNVRALLEVEAKKRNEISRKGTVLRRCSRTDLHATPSNMVCINTG
jgi:hypothetical protein